MKHNKKIDQLRGSLKVYFARSGEDFKVVSHDSFPNGRHKSESSISYNPQPKKILRGNEHGGLPKDGEDVSVRVMLEEANGGYDGKIRVTVHGRLEVKVGSREAVMRGCRLYSEIDNWVKSIGAISTGEEYARDSSPQERYLVD